MAADKTSADPPQPSSAAAAATTKTRGYVEVGFLFAAVGALLFSTKAVAIKLVYEEAVDAETLLALRMAFTMPFYIVIGACAFRERQRDGGVLPNRSITLKVLLIGLLGYWFASYTDFLGLEYISASFERLILFTYPLFVVIFGAAFFRQPINVRILLAVGLSYVGLALIFAEKMDSHGSDTAIGAGLVIAAAIAFDFYQLFARGQIAIVGPGLFTCIAMSGAAAVAYFCSLVLIW